MAATKKPTAAEKLTRMATLLVMTTLPPWELLPADEKAKIILELTGLTEEDIIETVRGLGIEGWGV